LCIKDNIIIAYVIGISRYRVLIYLKMLVISCPARHCPGQILVFLINIFVQNVYAIFLLIYYNIADPAQNPVKNVNF